MAKNEMPYHSIEATIEREYRKNKQIGRKQRDLSDTVTQLGSKTLELELKEIQKALAEREKENQN